MIIQELSDYRVACSATWVDADQIQVKFNRVSTIQPFADVEFYFTVEELSRLIAVLSESLEG